MKKAMAVAHEVERQNKSQWQKALSDHGKSLDGVGSFMSKPTFNKWLEGKSSSKLEDDNLAIIQSFIGKHGMGTAQKNGEEEEN